MNLFIKGMTPFMQIIREICNDPKDETKVDMIFANRVNIYVQL